MFKTVSKSRLFDNPLKQNNPLKQTPFCVPILIITPLHILLYYLPINQNPFIAFASYPTGGICSGKMQWPN